MNLSDYISEMKETPHGWAKKNGIPKDSVYRNIKGKPVDYDTAEKLSQATGGSIPALEIYKTGRSRK